MNTVCDLAIEIDRTARLEVMESVLQTLHCFIHWRLLEKQAGRQHNGSPSYGHLSTHLKDNGEND